MKTYNKNWAALGSQPTLKMGEEKDREKQNEERSIEADWSDGEGTGLLVIGYHTRKQAVKLCTLHWAWVIKTI